MPPTGADLASAQWATARAAASRALVTERIAAQARGDRLAWLAPLSGTALRDAQGAVFDRMNAIQVRDLRLHALTEVVPPTPIPSATTEPVTWDIRAAFDYDIAGFQTEPRSFILNLSLRATSATPGAVVIVDSQPGDRPQPWDLADLEVRRSSHSLVLGVGPSATLDEVVRRAEAAHDRVVAVWGSAAPAVVLLPATDEDAARLLGDMTGGLAGVAAVTDGPLSPGRVAGADRIVVVPGPWTSLTPTGREVVLTHELTHVAVRATTIRAVPLWLSEGFAEYVAYRSVRLSEAKIVAPLLAHVRTAPPAHLPSPESFDPANGTLPAAYGMALLAVRTLADTHGTAALVRFYRAAAGGLAVPTARLAHPERVVDDALAATLGLTRAQLERDWRARIAALAPS